MARSTARKRALNTLYEADEKNQGIESLLEERIAYPGAQTPLPEYAIEICRGIADHRKAVDRMLNRYSTKWTVGRMSVIDRNILRIGAWEILFNDEVPDGVAIDEAIALAKTMSDAGSPSFIHGLLSAVADHKDDIDSEGHLVSDKAEETEAAEGAEAVEGTDSADSADGADGADSGASQEASVESVDSHESHDSHDSDDWGDWDADLADPATDTDDTDADAKTGDAPAPAESAAPSDSSEPSKPSDPSEPYGSSDSSDPSDEPKE